MFQKEETLQPLPENRRNLQRDNNRGDVTLRLNVVDRLTRNTRFVRKFLLSHMAPGPLSLNRIFHVSIVLETNKN